MRLKNKLEIEFFSDDELPILITVDGEETRLLIHNKVKHTILLSPEKDTTISIQQLEEHNKFIFINYVKLGKMYITEFLHHYGICKVVLKSDNKKIADFVYDIGYPDIMTITIPDNIYTIILDKLEIVTV